MVNCFTCISESVCKYFSSKLILIKNYKKVLPNCDLKKIISIYASMLIVIGLLINKVEFGLMAFWGEEPNGNGTSANRYSKNATGHFIVPVNLINISELSFTISYNW